MTRINAQEVSFKIADAAMNLYRLGSSIPVNVRLAEALHEHLAVLIRNGMRDNQDLLDEGVYFLRRHEVKKVR